MHMQHGHAEVYGVWNAFEFFFFFWIWISKKDVYRKGYLMQNDHKAVQKITRKRRKNK